MYQRIVLYSMLASCPMLVFANELPLILENPIDIRSGTFDFIEQEQIIQPISGTFNLNEPNIDTKSVNHSFELGTGIEAEINQALLVKNWQQLEPLLAEYQQQADFDGILYDYALGALYRSQNKYHQAIKLYENLLNNHPEFHYIRFDLAVMMFENKQYNQAKQNFQQAKSHLNQGLQQLTEKYLNAIQQVQRIKPSFTLTYEHTDNVNNASSDDKIIWQGRTWVKSKESLPQQAHGVRYGVDLSKQHNMIGNHGVRADVGVNGVHYWDNSSYDEQRADVSIGYQYQDRLNTISVLPFIDYTWLDKKSYTQEQGLTLAWQHLITPKMRLSTSLRYTDKNYKQQRLANRYDSQIFAQNMTVSYAIKPNLVVFGGADISQENAKDEEYSYQRLGANLGVMAEHSSGLGGHVSLRYAERKFKQPEKLVYGFKREDDEYYVQTMFWHNKLQYKGFVPQLNVRYQKIDSNMDGFYSRDGVQSFISVDKKF